jgi:hypothetical protein
MPLLLGIARVTESILREHFARFQLNELSDNSLVREAIDICRTCRASGVEVRIFGGIAAAIVGQNWYSQHPEYRRRPKDIDLVGRRATLERFRTILRARGYEEDRRIALETEGQRALFTSAAATIDYSSDALCFAQELRVGDRLDRAFPTLPATDLILEKLQIVAPHPPQIFDFVAMLCSEPPQNLDSARMTQILGTQWCFWHSASRFLMEAKQSMNSRALLIEAGMIDELSKTLDQLPKSLRWKIRSWFSELLPWHDVVEPIG